MKRKKLQHLVSNQDFVDLIKQAVKDSSNSDMEYNEKINIFERLFHEKYLKKYENYEYKITDEELDKIINLEFQNNNSIVKVNKDVSICVSTISNLINSAIRMKKNCNIDERRKQINFGKLL